MAGEAHRLDRAGLRLPARSGSSTGSGGSGAPGRDQELGPVEPTRRDTARSSRPRSGRRSDEEGSRRHRRLGLVDRAVQFGVELAAEHAAELMFVHVVPVVDMVPATGFGIGGAYPHVTVRGGHRAARGRGRRRGRARSRLDHRAAARRDGEEILGYAESHDVDVIVVGSRGQGALSAALLGSVSREILHKAKRPVVDRACRRARPGTTRGGRR